MRVYSSGRLLAKPRNFEDVPDENLTLFAGGKAAMWIDATSGAGPLFDKSQSQVSDKVAFASAPIEATPNGSHWLWSWALAIPKPPKNSNPPFKYPFWPP